LNDLFENYQEKKREKLSEDQSRPFLKTRQEGQKKKKREKEKRKN